MTVTEERGVALQAAVDRLLPAIESLGPVGRPCLAQYLQGAVAEAMALDGAEGLVGAAVLDALRDVIMAVDAVVGGGDG